VIEAIQKTCDEIKEFLLKKNQAYGNSAADPVRIFSKVDSLEQINVRIDDKLVGSPVAMNLTVTTLNLI